jgi:hypothetical protein
VRSASLKETLPVYYLQGFDHSSLPYLIATRAHWPASPSSYFIFYYPLRVLVVVVLFPEMFEKEKQKVGTLSHSVSFNSAEFLRFIQVVGVGMEVASQQQLLGY